LVNESVLRVKDLRTYFFTRKGVIRAVDGVDFSINREEVLGLVGESGCGKSTVALSVMKLISPPGRIVSGDIFLKGQDLVSCSEKEMRTIRGEKITMVFQDPMTFLNPVIKVGTQISEVFLIHEDIEKEEAKEKTIKALQNVGIPSPEKVYDYYPYQMSGGMQQRALIAMATGSKPDLIIADEPTTALDVTIQAQILNLLNDLKKSIGSSFLYISHDLGVIAEICDKICIMYAGKIIESGSVYDVYDEPLHQYTKGLIRSVLSIKERKDIIPTIPGTVPDPLSLPEGCPFHPRCEKRLPICDKEPPSSIEGSPGHHVSCWLYIN
jgi:oligopeptide/dipeptide ABC transporter ATP-binding protein